MWGLKLINSKSEDLEQRLHDFFGGKADIVFEDTGNPDAFESALNAIAPGGKICALSITGKPRIDVDLDYIATRDITLIGTLASPNSFVPALRMIAAGKIDARGCITHRYRFEETPEALDFAKNSSGMERIKIVILNEEEKRR
jgi:L-iditol 2-dehydrogenase